VIEKLEVDSSYKPPNLPKERCIEPKREFGTGTLSKDVAEPAALHV
jgi:hypothetical protein